MYIKKYWISSLIILQSFISNVFADITYSVSVLPSEYNGSTVGVIIDGNLTPVVLNPFHNGFLWRGKGPKANSSYYYVILDSTGAIVQSESQFKTNPTKAANENLNFERQAPSGSATSTLNDIFGAKYTIGDDIIHGIPKVYNYPPSFNSFSLLYQEGQVQSIRVTCSEENYQLLISSGNENRDLEIPGCEMTVITPYDDFDFKNITFSLAGMGSRGFPKRPFKIELSEGENDAETNMELYNRKKFKLRNLAYDCTYIKNKLAMDLATAMGMEIGQSSLARVYVNNQPFGLYDLFDPIKKKFIKNNFHSNEQDPKIGVLYKCITAGGVRYFLENTPDLFPSLYQVDIYPSGVDETTFDGTADIKELIDFIANELDTATIDRVKEVIDVELLLKCIALEYFVEHRDGFLVGGNNYNIYRNYQTKQFHIWSYDFDATFGKFSSNAYGISFDQYMIIPEDNKASRNDINLIYNPFVEKLLKKEGMKERLMEIIGDVSVKAFNEKAFVNRSKYFEEFLKHHIYWDITQVLPTTKFSNLPDNPMNNTMNEINIGFNGQGGSCSGDVGGINVFIAQRSMAARAWANRANEEVLDSSNEMIGIPLTKFSKEGVDDSSTSIAFKDISFTLLSSVIAVIFSLMINMII